MKAFRILPLGLLVIGAAACASVEAPTPPAVTSSAPRPVEGYDWHLSIDEPEARLAYGLAESDELRLGLTCARGSGRLELSAMRPAGVREIHLESGGETERFPARSEPSELHEGVFLTAGTRTAEPVFQRFRKVGWLADWQGTARETYVPHPASAADIERFFAFCG